MQEYIFIPYDKRFPVMFMREKTKLKKVLPFAIDIEHFGSTAVPGLGGKGVLDIYILVPIDKFEFSKEKLVEAGYSFYNIKELEGGSKMIFRKSYESAEKTRKVNIHVGSVGITDFEKCITFRNKLRNNIDLCKKYEEIKKLAIKKTKNSGEDSKENSQIYVEAKESFIEIH